MRPGLLNAVLRVRAMQARLACRDLQDAAARVALEHQREQALRESIRHEGEVWRGAVHDAGGTGAAHWTRRAMDAQREQHHAVAVVDDQARAARDKARDAILRRDRLEAALARARQGEACRARALEESETADAGRARPLGRVPA